MPNIREYNSPEALQGIRPSELGADALAQSGRRIESVYHQAGEELGGGLATLGRAAQQVGNVIDRHNAMQEISTGAASLAKITSDLTDQWNQTANSSDLNDHTIADNFREKALEPALEQWQAGFSTKQGQEWALQRAASLRSHMFEKTSADMATRAGDALVANLQTTLNASSNLARNDPSSMPHAMDLYESALRAAAANSNADPSVVSKAITETLQNGKAQIATAAAIGMAQNNPDALVQEINKGTFNNYLDGSQIKQIEAYGHSQKNQQQAEFKAGSRDIADQYTNDMFDMAKGQVRPVTPERIGQIMSDPRMTETDKRSTVRFLQQQFKAQQKEIEDEQKAHSDPNLLAGLRARFAGDPSQWPTKEEIGQHLGAGDLSSTDAHSLLTAREQLSDTKDPIATKMLDTAVKDAHAQILGSTSPGDTSAADQHAVSRFDAWFWSNYQQRIARGATPQSLLDPASPSYLLTKENMQQFAIEGSDIVAPSFAPKAGASADQAGKVIPIPPLQKKPLSVYFGGLGGK